MSSEMKPWVCLAAVLASAFAFCGCSDNGSEAYLELARQSVQTGLDKWKSGEKPTDLKSGQTTIDFFDDDWQRSARLSHYEIVNAYMETDGTPRCVVDLTVEPAGQPAQKIQVTYQVVDKENSIAIARNPF